MSQAPYLDQNYCPISGTFSYTVDGVANSLRFDWDAAAVGPNGDLILVEKELTRPVVLHIQGHVSRAAFMVARGERIRKLVWIVRPEHFDALWSIVEPWRAVLVQDCGLHPPHSEYWTEDGLCLSISPAPLRSGCLPETAVLGGSNA
jgi:hypothetical protein